MNRQIALVAALGAVLLLVAFYFLGWAPKSEEVAEIEAQIETVLAQQSTAQQRIRQLEDVRSRAPQIEADLAASEAVLPSEAALPSALRQLQLAADDSGVTLLTIQPGRPAPVGSDGVASISLSLSLTGSYFQTIDFLRRVEDPTLVPRAILLDTAALAPTEYPELAVTLSGQMFAFVGLPPAPPAPEPTETPTDGATEDGDEA